MRLCATWSLIAALAVVAVGWGAWIGRSPVPPRPSDLATHVDESWYERLPLDPASATSAYLARVPEEMRTRGEAYSDSRLRVFEFRLLALLLATGLFCATGFAARTRDLVGRWTSRPGLIDSGVALAYFAAMFALTLPAEIYATFQEHQADLYSLNAARSPHGLAEFMIHDADTARLVPTTLEFVLFYTHPSDAERVRAAMDWRAAMAALPPVR